MLPVYFCHLIHGYNLTHDHILKLRYWYTIWIFGEIKRNIQSFLENLKLSILLSPWIQNCDIKLMSCTSSEILMSRTNTRLSNTIDHHNPQLLQYMIDNKNVNQGSENGITSVPKCKPFQRLNFGTEVVVDYFLLRL